MADDGNTESITMPKLVGGFFLRLCSTAFVAYYWYATKATPSDLMDNFFYKILYATTILTTIQVSCEWMHTLSCTAFYCQNGSRPYQIDELPGGSCVRCLNMPAHLCNLGRFITLCWITHVVFPLKDCVIDSGADGGAQVLFDDTGCTALHVMAIAFVATICLGGLVCCCVCMAMFCSAGTRDSALARHGSNALDLVVSPAVRANILTHLPLSKEPPPDDVCAICQEIGEEGSEWRVLPCKHRFHRECVDDYLRGGGVCPYCRHDFTKGEPADLEAGRGGNGIAPSDDPAAQISTAPPTAAMGLTTELGQPSSQDYVKLDSRV